MVLFLINISFITYIQQPYPPLSDVWLHAWWGTEDYESRIQMVERELNPPTNNTGDPLRSATAALSHQSWSLWWLTSSLKGWISSGSGWVFCSLWPGYKWWPQQQHCGTFWGVFCGDLDNGEEGNIQRLTLAKIMREERMLATWSSIRGKKLSSCEWRKRESKLSYQGAII